LTIRALTKKNTGIGNAGTSLTRFNIETADHMALK
jgi:hypothetical protein